MEDDFPGGVIGKIHATDQDMYDVLTFALKSEQKSLFKVNSHDGKIIALGGLDSGKYVLNVSVSDGRFQVPIDVVVHVEQLVHEMLQNTVTIRFENVSPEDFVGLHMHGFRRTLRNAVLTQKQDSLRIISIQPVAGTNQLDMLFAVEMHSSEFYKPAYLIQKLSNARRHLENVMRISAILEKNCSGLDCQEQHCEQGLSLDSHALMTYSTARISFVCPRFYRNVRCTCNGEWGLESPAPPVIGIVWAAFLVSMQWFVHSFNAVFPDHRPCARSPQRMLRLGVNGLSSTPTSAEPLRRAGQQEPHV